MEYTKNKYYIRLNENSRIVRWFSEVFEKPIDGDILIGEGYGVQFVVGKEVLSEELYDYADIENGLDLTNKNGLLQLKYENGIISKVSEVELEEQLKVQLEKEQTETQPTEIEVLKQENAELKQAMAELYEKNLELEKQNIDIMLAITELYEKGV